MDAKVSDECTAQFRYICGAVTRIRETAETTTREFTLFEKKNWLTAWLKQWNNCAMLEGEQPSEEIERFEGNVEKEITKLKCYLEPADELRIT